VIFITVTETKEIGVFYTFRPENNTLSEGANYNVFTVPPILNFANKKEVSAWLTDTLWLDHKILPYHNTIYVLNRQ